MAVVSTHTARCPPFSYIYISLEKWQTRDTTKKNVISTCISTAKNCHFEWFFPLVCGLGLFSRVWLFETQWTVACQDPLSMKILQAGTLEQVAMPSSRGSSQPRDRTASLMSPVLSGTSFTTRGTWEAQTRTRTHTHTHTHTHTYKHLKNGIHILFIVKTSHAYVY